MSSWGKADRLDFLEGSRLTMRHGKHVSYHRGLRPGHLIKGVTWELGRAESFPVKLKVQEQPYPNTPGTGESTEMVETQIKGQNGVSCEDSEKRTSTRRAFGNLSGS